MFASRRLPDAASGSLAKPKAKTKTKAETKIEAKKSQRKLPVEPQRRCL